FGIIKLKFETLSRGVNHKDEPRAMSQEYKLPKANVMATIDVLTTQDLADVLFLQEETRAALPPEQKMFVLPQPESYFRNLLQHVNGVMIGIRTGGKLIAQMALMGPLSIEEMIDGQKLTRNEIPFHHAGPTETAVIAKSMAVHPDWRGNELSQHMLEAAMRLPMARASDHMFAQVSVDNVRSWELFLRHGFGIVAAAIDPTDDKPRFILQRPAFGFALHHMQTTNDVAPAADFNAIMRLTQREALIGQLDSKGEAYKLAFYPSADQAAVWNDEPTGTEDTTAAQ
ncbi:MAG TPA: GNAT family N-acetyltransferase, partial [Alphaproteobacteria bacterium]|nr:GNAT family N-acetyltransferase [Alphaproteobacteria bacterium]